MENRTYHCAQISNHEPCKCCTRCHDLGSCFVVRSDDRDYTLCCHAVGRLIDIKPEVQIVKDIDDELLAI